MKSAIDWELIAPCGMNCAICSSYLAMKNELKTKNVKMPYCAGCRPRGKICSYIKKQCEKLSNNEVTYCSQCNSFPCHNLKSIDARYRARYHMSMIENLNSIKATGIEKFLIQQEKTWKCPACGGLICCHNGLCYNCQLEKLKSKKEKYCW